MRTPAQPEAIKIGKKMNKAYKKRVKNIPISVQRIKKKVHGKQNGDTEQKLAHSHGIMRYLRNCAKSEIRLT
jgi:hypothetical protein